MRADRLSFAAQAQAAVQGASQNRLGGRKRAAVIQQWQAERAAGPAMANDQAHGPPAAEPCIDAKAVLRAGTGEAGPAGVAAAVAAGPVQRKGGGTRKQQPTGRQEGGLEESSSSGSSRDQEAPQLQARHCCSAGFRKMQRSTELLIR